MRSVIALLPLFALLGGCDRQSAVPTQPHGAANSASAAAKPDAPASAADLDRSKAGTPMPRDSFVAPDGTKLQLSAFAGKPVLLNLWATWCGPCVRELPSFDALAARLGDRVHVVAVNQDGAQAVDPVEPWWREHALQHLTLYRDPQNGLGFTLASGLLPTTVLYDAQGREVWRTIGGMDWAGPRAAELLAPYTR